MRQILGIAGCPADADLVYCKHRVDKSAATEHHLESLILRALKMESLLSLSFDYLSSYDSVKVRKGLRQLEGLLAQICLSRTQTPQDRRHSIAVQNSASKQPPKELAQLKNDPAFREFFKLQEGFEFNGATSQYLSIQHVVKMS